MTGLLVFVADEKPVLNAGFSGETAGDVGAGMPVGGSGNRAGARAARVAAGCV